MTRTMSIFKLHFLPHLFFFLSLQSSAEASKLTQDVYNLRQAAIFLCILLGCASEPETRLFYTTLFSPRILSFHHFCNSSFFVSADFLKHMPGVKVLYIPGCSSHSCLSTTTYLPRPLLVAVEAEWLHNQGLPRPTSYESTYFIYIYISVVCFFHFFIHSHLRHLQMLRVETTGTKRFRR